MDWIQFYHLNRSRLLAWGGGLLAAATLCIVYFTSSSGSSQGAIAHVALERWKAAPSDTVLEKAARQSLRSAPHLERAFSAELAQILLTAGRISESETLAKPCIARLEEHSPLHASFAKTSLLIEKKEYQTALEQAVHLKEKTEPGSALYAYNLLRIACLQKQLNNGPGELAAWEDMRGILEGEHTTDAIFLLNANFSKQTGQRKFALIDFISQRERLLTAAP